MIEIEVPLIRMSMIDFSLTSIRARSTFGWPDGSGHHSAATGAGRYMGAAVMGAAVWGNGRRFTARYRSYEPAERSLHLRGHERCSERRNGVLTLSVDGSGHPACPGAAASAANPLWQGADAPRDSGARQPCPVSRSDPTRALHDTCVNVECDWTSFASSSRGVQTCSNVDCDIEEASLGRAP